MENDTSNPNPPKKSREQKTKLSKEKTLVIEERLGSREAQRQALKERQASVQLIAQNLITDDFRRTRRAGLILLGVPLTINLGFSITRRGRYLKNMFCMGSLLGCGAYFNNRLQLDLEDFLKKDTPYSNRVRQSLNNEYALNRSTAQHAGDLKAVIRERDDGFRN